MRTLGIASFLTLVSFSISAYADDTLNLKLPPAGAKSPVRSTSGSAQPGESPDGAVSRSASESESFEQYLSRHQANHGRVLASRSGGRPLGGSRSGGTSNERVVGRLGVAAHKAAIHSRRGSHRVLASVASGTYLALQGESGGYFGVLMSDRSVGWISRDDVQVLNYEVISNRTDEYPHPPAYAPGASDPLLTGGQRAVLDEAYRYLGVPYRYGGTSSDGLDCSALVQHCFAAVGVQLPRTAHEQIAYGMAVSPEDLRAADRLYFAGRDGRISHTGIYIGNGFFIHASSSHHGVAVSNLSEPLYRRMFAGARR